MTIICGGNFRSGLRDACLNPLCEHQIDRTRGKCADCARPVESETDAEEADHA